MKKSFLFLGALLSVLTVGAQNLKEYKLYTTTFQEWEAKSSSATEQQKVVTTKGSHEDITIKWRETEIKPTGTNTKFTADFITTGYAMGAKTATPYIRTSAFADVTKVEYVHAATANDRGWGFMVREAGVAKWDTLSTTKCEQVGSKVSIEVNRQNVELGWYNLVANQNAYMIEFTVYGMAEDDGSPEEYTVRYLDQNNKMIGQQIVLETEELNFAYTAADLTLGEGEAFRGWFTAEGEKIANGRMVNGDMTLHAVVNAIEVPSDKAQFVYDLEKPHFYVEDHECFLPVGGHYHNEHGWIFQNGDKLRLPVASDIYLLLSRCEWSKGEITLSSKAGELKRIPAKVLPDAADTVLYLPFSGVDTLDLVFSATTFLHRVEVYGVQGEIQRNDLGWYMLPAGDGNALRMTLGLLQDGDKVFLPNGVYDFGEKTLTTIAANNVSLIGESMEKTIIRNAPDVSKESIDQTATLRITGNNTYIQDLTIQNALEYYKVSTGRAVALWDYKTNHTICKNVRLLSYQDTYYSNNDGKASYFENGSIHGTVDFICGAGSVYFQEVELYCEKRKLSGGDSDVITASNAKATDRGYVFNNCKLLSECPVVSFGRAWDNKPQTVFLNTTVDYSAGNFNFSDDKIQRWTKQMMSLNVWPVFGEYGTHTVEGALLTPASNIVTYHNDMKKFDDPSTRDIETVLSQDEAEGYAYSTFYSDGWDPARECRQWEASVRYDNDETHISWDAVPGGVYLVYASNVLLEMTTETSFDLSNIDWNYVREHNPNPGTELVGGFTVRFANSRGGFGRPVQAGEEILGVMENSERRMVNGQKVLRDGRLYILNGGKTYDLLGVQIQ